MPDAARWDQVRRLFAAAMDLSLRERESFLARACAGDAPLRSEVAALLASHDASGPIDRLAAELSGAIGQVQTQSAPQPGSVVAHYTILDVLGAGGMGVVYRARDEQLQRLTALKFLPPHRVADAALKRRFLTEARAIGALDHPNVCTIYEIGETAEGHLYIAMPLYEGETLQALLARGTLPARRAIGIAVEIARGLEAAHSRGIIHRDVKPSNVMVLPDGHVKMLDFGVAKVKGLTGTASDARMGTLSYMSPEQIAGEALDQRSDVWSLGAVLYEMLTGRVPGARTYVPPSALRDDVPEALDDVVATALATLPERRFPSMAGLGAALGAITLDDLKGSTRAAADKATATAAPIRPAAERRRAAVLVSRVSHHDALVERLDPAALDRVSAAVRDAALDAVRRHGGILNQADGDQIVALFGIPAGQEDDDLRAVKAALTLHASVRAIQPDKAAGAACRIAVQTGIDSGSLVAQRLREESRRYGVTGAAADAAARLASAAAPDTILISPGCHRLVEPFLLVEPAPPIAVQHQAEPIVPLRVLGESGIHTRLEAADRSALTPFTGRAPQLSLLEGLVAESHHGRGRIAVVVGDAGIGKSRIIHELRERMAASSTLALTGRCRAYGGISAYLPVVDLLREILGVKPDDDAARVVLKVRETDESLEPFIPFYLHLLSVPPDVFVVPQHLRGEHFHAAMLDAIAALLMAAAGRSPLLLLLEDWHWADDASREVLQRIAEVVESHRMTVVVTTRPEPAALAELAAIGTVVHLEPLETPACLVLLRSLLGAERIGEDLVRRLQERTGGNPFFLEQVAHSLREEGAVVSVGDEAVLARDLDSLQLPATVQAVIRARLDRLDGDAREVLRIASAIGREFGAELLSAAVPGHIDTPRALERLRSASLIQQVRVLPDPAFRFKHILTLEVAYDSFLEHQRKAAHGAIGRALERQGVGRDDERAEALAHHFGKADLWPEAVRYGRRAAARLRAVSQFGNALALLDRLQAWLAHLPADESGELLPDILLEQERLCETLGQRRRQQAIITELISILAPRGASSRLAEAYLRQGDLLTLLKQFDAAERALNTALRLARDHGDRRLERSGLRSIGLLRWHQDRHLDALAIAEQALAFDRDIGDERSIVADLANIGNILRALGEHDRARAVLEEALTMPIVEREPAGMSSVLHNLANVHRASGDADTALACLLRADEAMQANMLPVHRSFHLTTIANIRLQRGEVEEAVQTYQQAVDLSRRARHAEGLAQALRLLGDVQFGLGRDAEAAANLSEAAGLFAQLEDPASQAEACARVGIAQERLGQWPAALEAWTAVLELRRSLSDPAGELEAREGLARATRRADPSRCIAAFEQALALATVLGAGSRQVALHNTLGILHWERGDFAAAFRHYDAALRLCRLTGDRVHEGLMLNCVGLTLTRLRRDDEARTVLEESVTLNRHTSERRLEAHALAALADISQREDARDLLEQALAIRRGLGDEEVVADLRRRLIELESATR
ncbi:MAG TPA: tetratricopeptide repeat protein [Vicinamibacterales bacterium]|nr:tetratricopeptide repeat protein [Vicinamibacterales bacterium]